MNTTVSPASSLSLPRTWWIAFAALVVIKLILVSHDEIELRAADDFGNALIASKWYWGNPYQTYTYTRQPGYPLFLALASLFGTPQRLWMEGWWMTGVGIMAVGLRRLGLRPLMILVAATLLLFHPTSLWLFNRLLPDGLFTLCSLLMLVGLSIAATTVRSGSMWRWGILACFAAAVAANTRQESPLVLGLMIVSGAVVLAAAWLRRNSLVSGPTFLARIIAACLLPLVVTLAATETIKQINRRTIGIAVTYDLAAPGLKSLYAALISIPPANSRLDLPMPRDVRDRAYAASSTMRRLEPFLDGAERDASYTNACKSLTGIDGEYGAWMVWALRSAAFRMGKYQWTSAAEMDDVFAKAADELREAQSAGTLPRRWVPHEYLPPEWALMRAHLPDSLAKCYRVASAFHLSNDPPENLAPWYLDRVNGVALRRVPLDDLSTRTDLPASWHQPRIHAGLRDLQERIAGLGAWLTYAGLSAFAVAGVMALFPRSRMPGGLRMLVLLVAALIVSRVLLFALLDANGIPVQERYMFPAHAALLLLIPTAIGSLITLLAPQVSA